MKNQITFNWKIAHNLAQICFLLHKDKLLEIYRATTKNRGLSPIIWLEFVDSKELWIYVMNMIKSLSDMTITDLAFSEYSDEGIMAKTGLEDYMLIPLSYGKSESEPVGTGDDTNAKLELACQQHIKRIMIHLFAAIYKNTFTVRFVTHPSKEYDENSVNIRLIPGGEHKHTKQETDMYYKEGAGFPC